MTTHSLSRAAYLRQLRRHGFLEEDVEAPLPHLPPGGRHTVLRQLSQVTHRLRLERFVQVVVDFLLFLILAVPVEETRADAGTTTGNYA